MLAKLIKDNQEIGEGGGIELLVHRNNIPSPSKLPKLTPWIYIHTLPVYVCILSGKSLEQNLRSSAVTKHQRKFMVIKTTSNVKQCSRSGAAPLYCSLVTSLIRYNIIIWRLG